MSELATDETTGTVEPIAEESGDIRETIAAEVEKSGGFDDEAVQVDTGQPEADKYDFSGLGFRKDIIPKLETLPPDIVDALVERDTNYKSGIEKYKGKAEIADEFTRALQPHAEYLTALEVSPTQFIPPLVQTEMTLRLGSEQQKVATLRQICHDYGIDPNSVAQMPFDPNAYRLQQEIAMRDRQLHEIQASQYATQEQQLVDMVGQWSQDKPYFEDVRDDMAFLLNAGKATDLDSAYAMAVRLNEKTFEKFQAGQSAERKKADALKANQLARQAKASAVQVNGKSSGGDVVPELKTAQDAVRYAFAKHGL